MVLIVVTLRLQSLSVNVTACTSHQHRSALCTWLSTHMLTYKISTQVLCKWSSNKKLMSEHPQAGLECMFALQLQIFCFRTDVTMEQADRNCRWTHFSVETFKISIWVECLQIFRCVGYHVLQNTLECLNTEKMLRMCL